MKVGKLLRTMKSEHGLTYDDLGEILGTHRGHVRKWCVEDNEPRDASVIVEKLESAGYEISIELMNSIKLPLSVLDSIEFSTKKRG
tara:strand:- start:8689 stop:8946 length:258 start_codon:yes stop_codon:yes gene_type:complete